MNTLIKEKKWFLKKSVLDPEKIDDKIFPPVRSRFYCARVVTLHLHIEGGLSERALAGEGWGGWRGNSMGLGSRIKKIRGQEVGGGAAKF